MKAARERKATRYLLTEAMVRAEDNLTVIRFLDKKTLRVTVSRRVFLRTTELSLEIRPFYGDLWCGLFISFVFSSLSLAVFRVSKYVWVKWLLYCYGNVWDYRFGGKVNRISLCQGCGVE